MSAFDRVAFVWGENVSGGHPAGPPSVSVSLWPHVLGCDSLRWKDGDTPDLDTYDLFLVNLFHTPDSTHIAQIRAARPDAVIVAMPDPSLDLVLMHPEWTGMIEQMALADFIGGRTRYDCEVYGALLGMPTVHLPSPIGPTAWFAEFRNLLKEDVIVALDHPMEPYASAHNVAALAAIQRETGMKVIYADARASTKRYAELAGLRAEWLPRVHFGVFVEMVARARINVDLYARHSFHRHAMVCAMVGTPCVCSTWTTPVEMPQSEPFAVEWALRQALRLLKDESHYEAVRAAAFDAVEHEYGFEATRQRMSAFMERAL